MLRDGRLAQVSAPDVLYRMPADLDLARFVGEAVVLPGEARSGVVTCALGTLSVHGEGEGAVQVMIRPEQIKIEHGRGGRGTAARVAAQSFYGPETMVHLELAGSRTAVAARTFDGAGVAVGDEVELVVEGAVAVYETSPRTAA